MNEPSDFQPASRSWRDIPQQVKPRAMSREGRRRYVVAGLKTAAAIGVLTLLVGGGVWLARTWSANPAWFSTASGQPAVKKLLLETNGRLSEQWVRATLALPEKITLMEVDLAQLQARLEQHRQIRTAEVTKILPASLAITLTERVPVVRLLEPGGETRLVGRDGVSFRGEGFAADVLEMLPLLTGVEPGANGAVPEQVAGMETVADLIVRAGDLAPQLLARWREINVSQLESDGLIEVRSPEILRIIFSKGYDFSDQLAWLDAVLARAPGPWQMVNVGLGPRVVAEPAPTESAVRAGARPAAASRPAPVAAAPRGPLYQFNLDP